MTDVCEFESRTRLLDLSVGMVEDLCRRSLRSEAGPEAFCDVFQICLPYRGRFVWHVAREDVVGDANQVIFVRAGEPYRMRGPIPEGYSELILTPQREVLCEVAHLRGQRLVDHPLFRSRSCRMPPAFQSFRAWFQRWASSSCEKDPLEAEEVVLAILCRALQQERPAAPRSASTARVIRNTKEFLAAHAGDRLLLADIGRAVGVSPAYLTDVFTRTEGVSLHRYLTQLRLARALIELPHAVDLTALALDIGFSSHSHFSFAFRRAYGCTPSQFRRDGRRAAGWKKRTNDERRTKDGPEPGQLIDRLRGPVRQVGR